MGFTIKELQRAPSGAMYVSPERIYVTADGEVVDGANPRAVRLLVAKGCEIPAAEAAKYGLIAGAEPEASATWTEADAPEAEAQLVAEAEALPPPARKSARRR